MLSKLFALAFVVGFFVVAYFVVAGPTLVAPGSSQTVAQRVQHRAGSGRWTSQNRTSVLYLGA